MIGWINGASNTGFQPVSSDISGLSIIAWAGWEACQTNQAGCLNYVALIAPRPLDFLRVLRIKTLRKIYGTFLPSSFVRSSLYWAHFGRHRLRRRPALFWEHTVFGRNLRGRPGCWAPRHRLVLGRRSRQR